MLGDGGSDSGAGTTGWPCSSSDATTISRSSPSTRTCNVVDSLRRTTSASNSWADRNASTAPAVVTSSGTSAASSTTVPTSSRAASSSMRSASTSTALVSPIPALRNAETLSGPGATLKRQVRSLRDRSSVHNTSGSMPARSLASRATSSASSARSFAAAAAALAASAAAFAAAASVAWCSDSRCAASARC